MLRWSTTCPLYFEFLSFKLIARFLQFTFSTLTPFFMAASYRAFSSHLILSYRMKSDLPEGCDEEEEEEDDNSEGRLGCSSSCLTDPSPHRQLEPVLCQGHPPT